MTAWIRELDRQCKKTSQTRVAKAIQQPDGFPSATIINQVLHDKYPSKRGMKRLQELVEGRYMGVTVLCPVLGEIGTDECANWSSQPANGVNPHRVQMYRACLKCPHGRKDDD